MIVSSALHDVGSDDSFVVLAAGDLTQIQEISDHSDQETILLLLKHATADAANGPA